mgnify:CR=1 FL=1
MNEYQQYGIVKEATYSGHAFNKPPSIIQSEYSTARVVFSTGDFSKSNYKVWFVEMDAEHDYLNTSYVKTLTKKQEVNIIYFEDNPENDVIFEAFLLNYLERSFFSKYGINLISFIMTIIFFILWRNTK